MEVIVNCATGETTVIPPTPEEELALAWRLLRFQRDNFLSESDWTQVADSPVNKVAWAAYRQALRDLPANTTDPFSPIWPVKP